MFPTKKIAPPFPSAKNVCSSLCNVQANLDVAELFMNTEFKTEQLNPFS
ncbi:hypothetical protein [uncultured Methanobrevibacter sp.]|nr:hypothetical protein [uncultured Methanobrevibacter sp.]